MYVLILVVLYILSHPLGTIRVYKYACSYPVGTMYILSHFVGTLQVYYISIHVDILLALYNGISIYVLGIFSSNGQSPGPRKVENL